MKKLIAYHLPLPIDCHWLRNLLWWARWGKSCLSLFLFLQASLSNPTRRKSTHLLANCLFKLFKQMTLHTQRWERGVFLLASPSLPNCQLYIVLSYFTLFVYFSGRYYYYYYYLSEGNKKSRMWKVCVYRRRLVLWFRGTRFCKYDLLDGHFESIVIVSIRYIFLVSLTSSCLFH